MKYRIYLGNGGLTFFFRLRAQVPDHGFDGGGGGRRNPAAETGQEGDSAPRPMSAPGCHPKGGLIPRSNDKDS